MAGTVGIAVCDPASSYRRGLGAALADEGYRVEEVDPHGDFGAVHVVLMTVRTPRDWQLLRQVASENQGLKLLALLVEPTADRHAEALRCGAHASVDWKAPPEAIVPVVAAAVRDMTLLPTAVARAMGVSASPLLEANTLTDQEVGWLRLLARGETVHQLAAKVGYSERALYRLLQGVYGRMGARSRTEAIVQAGRLGLLDE